VVGQRLQHQHFGNGIGFGATHLRGKLQPEHAGLNESIYCIGGQRSQLFALWTGSAQRLADAVDGIQKKSSLGRALLGKRLRHFPPPASSYDGFSAFDHGECARSSLKFEEQFNDDWRTGKLRSQYVRRVIVQRPANGETDVSAETRRRDRGGPALHGRPIP
jgi:hypothetical protein